MPRSILLFTGPWADLSLETLAGKAGAWGYSGFELCCWGDHLEVQRGLSDDAYGPSRLELLARNDLQVPVIANHKVGQAVCDVIDRRHQALLPDYIWGDGSPTGVQERAAEEMAATFRLAERLGAGVVSGFTGSPVWGYVAGYPAPKPEVIADALKQFARQWNPILDVARDSGVRFGCEVHPGQLAFDLYSAEVVLDALEGREEFGFTFDPSHMHWQGVDPVEFLRRLPRPHLSRPRERCAVDVEWPVRHPLRLLAQRRSALRLAVPLARPRRHRLAGDRAHTQRHRLRRSAVGRLA